MPVVFFRWAPASADPGITNGRIPRVYGRAMSQMGVPYSWGGGNANGPSRGIDQGAHRQPCT